MDLNSDMQDTCFGDDDDILGNHSHPHAQWIYLTKPDMQ